ncbi:hypothetical protein [Hymenobacter terrestris]|uniref:Uncharacterized protein n=1 Tax=Hymenobacter terrestris TaxID=2748310 RepID=A0ABX2PYH1_9BACT|nr:hypothetical protein [Hymenobacter terrestris]NVO83735.1 hypothetical protein [Hymenobacter terrestris]
MSFFSFTNSVDTQTAIRLAFTSTTTQPMSDAGAPPPLPPGTRQRYREIKAQAHCRTHARSTPHSSAKRW